MSEKLSETELRCLRFIAGLDSQAQRCCDEVTLRALERRQLVRRATAQWLPLERQRKEYQLTVAGRALLKLGPSA